MLVLFNGGLEWGWQCHDPQNLPAFLEAGIVTDRYSKPKVNLAFYEMCGLFSF